MIRTSILLLCVSSAIAAADGRVPATSTIHFEQGHPATVAAGVTFGLPTSNDGGTTWRWTCSQAVGYTGAYDPSYAYSSSGALFASTFDGLKVTRNGCSYASEGSAYASQDTLGPDGTLYYSASDVTDTKIYKSTNDGATFPTSAAPAAADLWDSLVVAPSDASRVYLTGYKYVNNTTRNFFVFKSVDGGQTYTAMSTEGLTASASSEIQIVGVDPTNADIVYAKVSLENGTVGDGIYKSTNGGGVAGDPTAWTKILDQHDPYGLSFLARSNHDLIAAMASTGVSVSSDGGATWNLIQTGPHVSCLAENPGTHELWACTNFEVDGGALISKTSNLATWSPVLRFADIVGPVACSAGTVQHDQCASPYEGQPSTWCCLAAQLGIGSTEVDCTGTLSCGAVTSGDAGIQDPGTGTTHNSGCNMGGGGSSALLVVLGTGALLFRSRRRR